MASPTAAAASPTSIAASPSRATPPRSAVAAPPSSAVPHGGVHDVVVVGGGPVGLALALVLAESDVSVLVLDARERSEPARADRTLALSHGSQLILSRTRAWQHLVAQSGAVTPIRVVDVSERGGFGRVQLDAAEHGVPALGYVTGYRALQQALDDAAAEAATPIRFGARVRRIGTTPAYAVLEVGDDPEPVVARLVVVADGDGSVLPGVPRVRYDYRQSALVGFVASLPAASGIAYERFTPDGPAALLPFGDEHAFVWTTTPARAAELEALAPDAFVETLQRHVGELAGKFVGVRDRHAFPLALQFAPSPARARCVLVGNAAQTLHPVAGQGFNLGLRDAFELARAIVASPTDQIGSREMSERYGRGRWRDRVAGIGFTHALAGLFGIRSPLVAAPRGAALALLDAIPPARRAFTRAMLFGLR